MALHSAGNSRPSGGIPRLRPQSIALLSYGFRLFFLAAALWAFIAMVLWIGDNEQTEREQPCGAGQQQ
jgi:uncharacterized protein involved in response to NO